MIHPHILSLVTMGGWLVLAFLAPLLPARLRQGGYIALVIVGVLALGWLTLHWGPVFAFGALALGIWALILSPVRARREVHAETGSL